MTAAVRGFVFNARDVTQRRQMETDLRRSQAELTHVLRLGTISEIASALAHEINRPLAAISNYASACAPAGSSAACETSVARATPAWRSSTSTPSF